MRSFLKITALLLLVTLSSCYTYHVPRTCRHLQPPAQKQTVYVVNPELKKEYDILRNAGFFNITGDSTAAVKIKLDTLHPALLCGNGMILTMITIGQVPSVFPDSYTFSYHEIRDNDTLEKTFIFRLTQRVWFWDMFVFNKRFNEKAGKCLLGAYYGKD